MRPVSIFDEYPELTCRNVKLKTKGLTFQVSVKSSLSLHLHSVCFRGQNYSRFKLCLNYSDLFEKNLSNACII